MIPKVIGHQINHGKGLIGLIRRGWWEIPEIMGATCLAFVGLGLALAGLYKYDKNNGEIREFHNIYIVMRPGDPRACKLKNPVYTEHKY